MIIRYKDPAELGSKEREEMLQLMTDHFKGVDVDVFTSDLEEKSLAITIRDGEDSLVGFSTQLFYSEEVEGKKVEVVCSGDTVIARSARYSTALSRAWLRSVIEHAWHQPNPVYWLFICSSSRTYRFLPLYWEEFYPNPDNPTPQRVQSFMRELGARRWGGCFNHESGIVKLPSPQVAIEANNHSNGNGNNSKYERFFLQKNPGVYRGDELLCLARISPDNLTHAGRRILRSVNKAETEG